MLKDKASQAEQIRRLEEVTADEDDYFQGVLGNPVTFAARWGLPLSKQYRDSQGKNSATQSLRSKSAPIVANLPSRTGQRIRIRLKAFDRRVIDQSAREIADSVKRYGGRMAGPAQIRTRVERVAVKRSPHSQKNTSGAFEQRTHRRLIDIIGPTAKTLDELKKLNLPAGVDIIIKI
jgi:small subunit ribosomal protein S10